MTKSIDNGNRGECEREDSVHSIERGGEGCAEELELCHIHQPGHDDAVTHVSGKITKLVKSPEDSCRKPQSSNLMRSRVNEMSKFFYLSLFAILGETLRVLLGEMLGSACEYPENVESWIRPFSNVCVTANGQSAQSGGAFSSDLPANMLGSFLMGLFSTGSKFPHLSTSEIPVILFHPASSFQNWQSLHLGLRTGFFGSLTTFASWNSQMVVMMDGSGTILGPQVISAIFGYILGLQTAFMSLKFGQHVAQWCYVYRMRCSARKCADKERQEKSLKPCSTFESSGIDLEVSDIEKSVDLSISDDSVMQISYTVASILAVLVGFLCFLFVVLDHRHAKNGNSQSIYRTLWMSAIFSPFGALLRWKMSSLNRGKHSWPSWICMGTFLANILGSLVSITSVLVMSHLSGELNSLALHVLIGIKTGFAGCLSTVSTFVDEIDSLSCKYPLHAKPYIYAVGTVLSACLSSLCIYSLVGSLI